MTGSRPAAALDPPDELVRRAARGDVAAFARLVRLHDEAMTRVAFVVTGDRDTAASAAEAAWVEAWAGLPERPSALGLGSWLASLAAARAVALARGEPAGDSAALALLTPTTSLAPGPSLAPSPSRAPAVPVATDPATDAGLATALARLDPEDRASLALLHVAGLTPSEVAAVRRRSRLSIPLWLERLASGLRGSRAPGAGADPDADPAAHASNAGLLTTPRLRAYAEIPVRPIDADALARRARAEAKLERTRVLSVAVATVVGVLVALHPYLAMLAFGR